MYKLKNLKFENVTSKARAKIKERLASNPTFIPSEMRSINMAGKSICEWIHAMNNFMDVYDEIKIKKENCKQMDQLLTQANKDLAVK